MFCSTYEIFCICYNNQVLLILTSRCVVLLAPSKKRVLLSLSVWPAREYTWTLIWKKSLLICFESYQGVPYSHRQSRKRMMKTFIIVTLSPHVRESSEDKSMLSPSKKSLFSPFRLARKRIYLNTHLKEELTGSFWKLRGYPLFPQAE